MSDPKGQQSLDQQQSSQTPQQTPDPSAQPAAAPTPTSALTTPFQTPSALSPDPSQAQGAQAASPLPPPQYSPSPSPPDSPRSSHDDSQVSDPDNTIVIKTVDEEVSLRTPRATLPSEGFLSDQTEKQDRTYKEKSLTPKAVRDRWRADTLRKQQEAALLKAELEKEKQKQLEERLRKARLEEFRKLERLRKEEAKRKAMTDAQKKAEIDVLSRKYKYDGDDSEDEQLDDQNQSLDHQLIILRLRKSRRQALKGSQNIAKLFKDALVGVVDKSSTAHPIFTGSKDEKASAHLLLVKDWMEKHQITEEQIVDRFQETLKGGARVWYDELAKTGMTWSSLQQEFTIEFSKQGKSIMDLKNEWVNFKFDPNKGDIRKFIRDVETTAKLLHYDEDHIVTALHQAMPPTVFYAVVSQKNLPALKAQLTDIFKHAPKEQQSEPQGATGGNPFLVHQHSQPLPARQVNQPQYVQPAPYTVQQVAPAPVSSYWEASPAQFTPSQAPSQPPPAPPRPTPPYKPQITGPSRGRGRPLPPNRGDNRPQGRQWQRSPRPQQNWSRDNRDRTPRNRYQGPPRENRGRYREKYDPQRTRKFQNPNPNPGRRPRLTDADKQKLRDEGRCYYCKEEGHWADNCPQKQRQRQENPYRQRQVVPVPQGSANMYYGQNQGMEAQFYQYLQQPYHYTGEEQEEVSDEYPLNAESYLTEEEN